MSKAILVIDMPINKCESCMFDMYGCSCLIKANMTDIEKMNDANFCPLKPVHSLKSGGKDYIIYERQFLYDNFEREIEMLKKGKEIYESNISN